MRRMYDRSEVADPTNHYTKTESDAKYATKAQIASVFNYKGTKATASALPSSGNTVGDVWAVTDEDNELYVWNGTSWDDLGNNYVEGDWVNMTLLNGHTGTAKVRKNAVGQLEIYVDVITPNPYQGQAIGTIPAGYRPSVLETRLFRRSAGGDLTIWIGTNGTFNAFAGSSAGVTIQGTAVIVL